MAGVRWSPRAWRDLKEVTEYYAQVSNEYSRELASALLRLAADIPALPFLGPIVDKYAEHGIRERLHDKYRLLPNHR